MSFMPQRFHVVHTAPAWMSMPERVLLYGLVAALRPERILKVGTSAGGATMIMCAALDDLGAGHVTCVAPEPRIADEDWEAIRRRATLVPEPSPDGIARARELAGGPFGLALIDGDHLNATLPALADAAHLLVHGASVRDGIGGQLHDAGLLSGAGDEGGLRLLRYVRSPA